MHIGIVGGLDRNEGFYDDLARRAGHHFEHHNGHLAVVARPRWVRSWNVATS